MGLFNAGSSIKTADGVLGTSGAVTRVYSMHILSGGSAGVVNLRAGTLVTDTIWIQETGTASTGKTFVYGEKGNHFSGGVYVDVDANVTSVVISYSQ